MIRTASPLAAETATLADLLALADTFRYDYVYGEDWAHTVALEGRAAANPAVEYPRLVERARPLPARRYRRPDGLRDLSAGDRRPEHLHHEGMIEWDDPDFDPNVVDEAAIRANLANLGKYLGRRKSSRIK